MEELYNSVYNALYELGPETRRRLTMNVIEALKGKMIECESEAPYTLSERSHVPTVEFHAREMVFKSFTENVARDLKKHEVVQFSFFKNIFGKNTVKARIRFIPVKDE